MSALKTDRKKVYEILCWCYDVFGESKYQKGFPKLVVRKNHNSLYGSYTARTNTIMISVGAHTHMRELCNTVLHEFKHYKLPYDEYSDIYWKLLESGISLKAMLEEHPHERKCNKFAKKWERVCYEQLKPILHSRKKS